MNCSVVYIKILSTLDPDGISVPVCHTYDTSDVISNFTTKLTHQQTLLSSSSSLTLVCINFLHIYLITAIFIVLLFYPPPPSYYSSVNLLLFLVPLNFHSSSTSYLFFLLRRPPPPSSCSSSSAPSISNDT